MRRRPGSIAVLLATLAAALGGPAGAEGPGPAVVDASTLRGKVLCGYQGWFRCPGDPTGEGWRHWSRDGSRIAPETLTFEMWPDLAEAGPDERFAAPGFTHPDGKAAFLFSSAHPKTVDRHFRWMERYGIDGVFAQRFLVELDRKDPDRVLELVRASAHRTGRAFALGYDLSGMPSGRIVEALRSDWARLVDGVGLTGDARYLRHDGRPVVFVWGFYPDRFGAETAHRIIDIFRGDDGRRATLIGGTPWAWRAEADPAWARAFRRFDAISPWNVGNSEDIAGRRQAATGTWPGDLAEAKASGMLYLPVVYPGFAWTHLKGPGASAQALPRLGGDFFWRQFARASELKIDMAYVAMFDEVDEGTAVFKVADDPPTQARFTTFDGLPADWYLRLTGEATRLIREGRPVPPAIPIRP